MCEKWKAKVGIDYVNACKKQEALSGTLNTKEGGECEKVRCPSCGSEEHTTQGEMYWECGFCDEMIPEKLLKENENG